MEQKFDEQFYFLDRQSNRVSRYRYKFQDKWYIIPYDKNTHKVITIFEDNKQDTVLETKPEIANQSSKNYFAKLLQNLIKFFKNITISF